ncbi:MAG: 3'(2'),5'-bisphosphate nucleotidase CysQ [Deltaproteobacteria bacterium]|nr:3'(2'),5'-bisphosphate nucleotidase CysQ [Deltaproteobacteria bacterium]
MTLDLDRELRLAVELAERAGAVLRGFFGQPLAVERKAGNEPVTEADRAAEEVVLAGLRAHFPDDGILAEEHADKTSWATYRRVWLVDPLDGTRDFVAGREGYSVMIGLLIDGEPVLGVVYQPATGLSYEAAVGQGSFRRHGTERAPLVPTAIADPAQARLVASRSHRSPRIDAVKDKLQISDELNVGSVGLKVGLVAAGVRELYINPDSHCRLWDICAPEAVLTLAGGRMTDLFGDPLRYDDPNQLRVLRGILATNGACHAAVLEQIAPIFPRPS